MDPTDFTDLLGVLNLFPPAVQLLLLKSLATLCLLMIFVLCAKHGIVKAIGAPQPNDPQWKTRFYQWTAWLDAFTPDTFRSLLELARKEQVIRTLQVSPPVATSIAPAPIAPAPTPASDSTTAGGAT